MIKFIDAYAGSTAGQILLTKEEVVLAYSKFLIANNWKDLVYEYDFPSARVFFITGKNEEEQNLPLLSYPLSFEYLKEQYIVVDLRSCVSVNRDKDFVRIESIVSDNKNLLMKINMLIYMIAIGEEDPIVSMIENNLALAFAEWVSGMLSPTFNLDLVETNLLKVACFTYFIILNRGKDIDEELKDLIASKVNNNKGFYSTAKEVRLLLKDVKTEEKVYVTDLVKLIKQIVNTPKIDGLDMTILTNVLANSWYGINTKELIYVSLDYSPVFLAILYSAITDKSFKKTKFATIINRDKRNLDLGKVEKLMKNFSKDIRL